MKTEVSPLPLKLLVPIVVTESGIVIDARLPHPTKALSPIEVTESGITTDAKLLHP